MDRERRIIPAFATEAEEARWWFENQDRIERDFEQAAADGTLRRGTLARRGISPPTSIRLDSEDVSKAQALAERRGLQYQTYLKTLIHDALEREEKLTI